jgi:hypothetical protein
MVSGEDESCWSLATTILLRWLTQQSCSPEGAWSSAWSIAWFSWALQICEAGNCSRICGGQASGGLSEIGPRQDWEVPAFGGQGISSKATVREKIFSSSTSKQPGPATWRRSKRAPGEGGWRCLDKGTGELGEFGESNPGAQQGRVKTRPPSKRLQYRPGAARFRKLRTTLGTCCFCVAGVSGGRLRLCKDNQLSLMEEGSCIEGSAHVPPRGDEVRRVRQQSHSQPGSCCRWLVGWQRKRDGGRGGHAITVAER